MTTAYLHRCLACGAESHDVTMRLVEIVPAERRMVEVSVPVSHRDGAVEVSQTVPELYGHEPRCRDQDACRERVAALELARPTEPVEPGSPLPAHAADAAPSWMPS